MVTFSPSSTTTSSQWKQVVKWTLLRFVDDITVCLTLLNAFHPDHSVTAGVYICGRRVHADCSQHNNNKSVTLTDNIGNGCLTEASMVCSPRPGIVRSSYKTYNIHHIEVQVTGRLSMLQSGTPCGCEGGVIPLVYRGVLNVVCCLRTTRPPHLTLTLEFVYFACIRVCPCCLNELTKRQS